MPGTPLLPSTEEMSTRCPEPLWWNISSAVSIWTSAATRLVSMVFLFAHSLPVPIRPPLPMPALTMMRSMPPSSSLSSANTFGTCSWSRTSSVATAILIDGYCCDSPAFSSSSRSVRRAHSARSRPLAAKARAIPAPRPELAPVMRIFWRVTRAAYRLLEQPRHAPVGQHFAAGLTRRAVLKRLVRERHFPHGVPADRAGQPGAGMHPQSGALLPLERRGPFANGARHRVGQHRDHRVVQGDELLVREFPGRRERRDLRDVKNLVAVGVADAGDHLLVGDDGLYPPGVTGQDRGKVLGAEFQRVRSKRRDLRHELGIVDHPYRQSLLRAGLSEVEAERGTRGAQMDTQRDRSLAARPQRRPGQLVRPAQPARPRQVSD